jgi:hypothetical protein
MSKRTAATVSGLMIAGGTAFTASAAYAAGTSGTTRLTAAPAYTVSAATGQDLRRRCRWIRGHYRYVHRHGMRTRVWIPGHRVC